MAELVDAPDLKSVGQYARAGSIPAIRTMLPLKLPPSLRSLSNLDSIGK